MDNTGVVLAEEEGAVPNDKERNLSTESPQNKPIPVNTVDTPIHPTPPINPTPPTMPEFLTNPNSPSQEIPLANSNDQSQAKPPTNEKPKPFTNPQPKPRTNQKAKPPTPPQPKPPTNQKPKLSTNPQPKPPTNQNPKPPTNSRPCTRSVAKGKAVLQARQKGGDALSSDSYDSDEDSLYKPRAEESSSSDDGYYDNDVCKAKTVEKDIRFKHAPAAAFSKHKDQVTIEDDAYVEEVSDGDVDLGFVGGTGDDAYNAYDPGADSDSANSWHSEEMKTPPNSEDEWTDEESSDVCPVFREGIRFGELQLEVGMKFNTKWDFKEAVREFTIQEGRRIRFRKNDNVRMRATCQVKGCPWVVYASRDHEDTCWQIKTFVNDHTCPREDKNKAANRNWVASKLVKKVRKYPNFKHCDAATYFKSRFDLTLNKNSISRALFDARNAVFGDEKEQYKMLRDYGLTLLKTNPGSTVEICCTPQPESDPVFDKMYVCLNGCKNGFKAGC
ncbi:hypothetical protein Ahy_A06g027316 isoform B [Arachis hypogaea]|nr:hypothetical protein Ahy_A06g027316 isoform B [Arachis hypogaea]